MPTPDYCDLCHIALDYSDQWDSVYCTQCNQWKEEKTCKPEDNDIQIECWFECWNRPERPIND